MDNNSKIFIAIAAIIPTLLFFIPKIKTEKEKNIIQYGGMLNIYNQKLEKCGNEYMSNGSWDSNKKCSELEGGVHQICVNKISKNAKNFSQKTGQSNWSDNRNNDNHCVCLGAWSLYVAKKKRKGKQIKKGILKCDAIPKISLSESYVSKFNEGWNKWNGNELDEQIKDGVEKLFDSCYTGEHKDELRKNYCDFAKSVPSLRESSKFSKYCKNT